MLTAFVGFVLAVALWSVVWAACPRAFAKLAGALSGQDRMEPCALSRNEMLEVGGAIDEFVKANGFRPPSLDALVTSGLLNSKTLHPDGATADSNPSAPHVLYQSALQPGDPSNLVLLYCLFPDAESDSYLLVRNDGRLDRLPLCETIDALNHTFRYLALTGSGESPARLTTHGRILPEVFEGAD